MPKLSDKQIDACIDAITDFDWSDSDGCPICGYGGYWFLPEIKSEESRKRYKNFLIKIFEVAESSHRLDKLGA